MDNIDFGKLIKEKLEEAYEERGHANVLIAGRTGVGKSTLINSIFQGNLATTGHRLGMRFEIGSASLT